MGVTFTIFSQKREYLGWARRPDTYLITLGEFPLNPLLHRSESWPERFVETITTSTELRQVSSGDLVMIVNFLVEEFKRTQPELPAFSLYELKIAISRLKSKLKYSSDRVLLDYVSRLEDRISSVLCSSIGKDFAYYAGVPMEELLFRNVVLDLSNVISQHIALILNLWLSWRFHFLLCYGKRDGRLTHIIVLDEASELLGMEKGVSGLSLTERFYTRLREFGTLIVTGIHSWNALDNIPLVKNNVNIFFMLMMSNYTDCLSMARAMAIDSQDSQNLKGIRGIVPGMGIVKIAGIERAIPVAIPKVEERMITDPVTEDELEQMREKTRRFVSQFELLPVPDQEKVFVMSEILKEAYVPQSVREKKQERLERHEEYEKEFVARVRDNPMMTAGLLKRKLSFGGSNETFNIIKSSVLEKNLAFEVQRNIYKEEAGRPRSRFGLRSSGYELLGIEPKGEGKGELQRFFLEFVEEHYGKQGFKVRREGYAERADLYVERNDGSLWLGVNVSVTTGVEHELRQSRRILEEDGVEAVLVIVVQLNQQKKNVYVVDVNGEQGKAKNMKEEIEKESGDDARIVVLTFGEFVKNGKERAD